MFPEIRIYGPLLPAEARTIADKSATLCSKQVYARMTLGAELARNTVALVYEDKSSEADSVARAKHYISLDPDNVGEVLRPDGETVRRLGLPEPEEAYQALSKAGSSDPTQPTVLIVGDS